MDVRGSDAGALKGLPSRRRRRRAVDVEKMGAGGGFHLPSSPRDLWAVVFDAERELKSRLIVACRGSRDEDS